MFGFFGGRAWLFGRDFWRFGTCLCLVDCATFLEMIVRTVQWCFLRGWVKNDARCTLKQALDIHVTQPGHPLCRIGSWSHGEW